jgi:hypothetical protein
LRLPYFLWYSKCIRERARETEMLEINHELEKSLTADTGHDHGCWEEYRERQIEAWAEREGHDIDNLPIAGRHDDIIDGRTAWEHYVVDVLCGTECYCYE